MNPAPEKRDLPRLTPYQSRSCEGASGALRRGRDVLIEAPTGAGKTPMIARSAKAEIGRGGKVLVLTHRKTLFRQMAGNPAATSEKGRRGEMEHFAGIRPGTVAEEAMGGTDQSPGLVVAMVETAAARLDALEQYSAIFIDEAQHVSEESACREDRGSYARILEAQPGARLVALTATTFRGDEDRLHPRIEAAHREVVSIEEARAAGRIVPARTIIGRARTEKGHSAKDLVELERAGRLKGHASASAALRAERGDAFYDRIASDWEDVAGRGRTILFVDSVDEVEDMTRRLDGMYGAGTAACLHGRDRSRRDNDSALRDYEEGRSGILVACKMIGEGYDVPETDFVMSANASLSRLDMNQYVGRTLRTAPGKAHGTFIDYGTATHRHGPIEHQHGLQNIDALAASRSKISAARAYSRMAPAKSGDWRAVPGEKTSLLVRQVGAKHHLFRVENDLARAMGKRKAKGQGAGDRLSRWDHPVHGTRPLDAAQLAGVLSDHAKREAGHISLMGGLDAPAYGEACAALLSSKGGAIAALEVSEASLGMTQQRRAGRRAILREVLDNPRDRGLRGRALRKALDALPSGREKVEEIMALSGEVLSHCAVASDLPLGLRSESRDLGEMLSCGGGSGVDMSGTRREAKAVSGFLGTIRAALGDDPMAAVVADMATPLAGGIRELGRDMQAKRAAQRT